MKKIILIGILILMMFAMTAATLTYTCTAGNWYARQEGDKIVMRVFYACTPSNPLKPVYIMTREKRLPVIFVD